MIFTRKVNYHETDKMAIVHHSNYVKYMEEARIYYLEQAGLPFEMLEGDGIASPVVAIDLSYKHPSQFGDTLQIDVTVAEYSGVRLAFSYVMKNQKGELVCRAKSQHCFTFGGKVISLQNGFENYHTEFERQLSEQQ
ncbi:MAG: acyl-CoA thioesterase [Bacteroidales bacterium]|nr:acyl-CoA thioesterase [Bacteroidales bacterium]